MAKYFIETKGTDAIDLVLEEKALNIAKECGYDDVIGIAWDVEPGEQVDNGYTSIVAPKEPGRYTLYQFVTEDNCHGGFLWLK